MNAETAVKLLKNLPVEQSVMLRARHGVGKSSVVKQVAKDLGYEFFDVRLSQCEVGDIKGLPGINHDEKRTEFYKPFWWPRDPSSKGILFFDELNRASKDVLQAVFEVCLDRRLDGEALPAGWRVVAAINAEDDYDVAVLDPALADRWFMIDFEPTVEEWVKYASSQNVHSSVIDFITQNSNLLDPPVGTSSYNAGEIYPSRRSWVRFHEACDSLGLWDTKDYVLMTQVAKGWLGSAISVAFPSYFQNEYSRLKADDIIDSYDDVAEKIERACADVEVIASLADSVLRELEKRDKPDGNGKVIKEAQVKNIIKFWNVVPKDVASDMWRKLLGIKKLRAKMQEYVDTPEGNARLASVFGTAK